MVISCVRKCQLKGHCSIDTSSLHKLPRWKPCVAMCRFGCKQLSTTNATWVLGWWSWTGPTGHEWTWIWRPRGQLTALVASLSAFYWVKAYGISVYVSLKNGISNLLKHVAYWNMCQDTSLKINENQAELVYSATWKVRLVHMRSLWGLWKEYIYSSSAVPETQLFYTQQRKIWGVLYLRWLVKAI